MKELSKRTAGFTDSVIRRMTRISNRYGAINLSQGFPDFDPPKEITDRLKEIADSGPHQYALTWGAQNFREALAKKQEHFYGMKVVFSVSDPVSPVCVVFALSDPQPASMEAAIIVVISSAVNFLNFMFTSLYIFEVINLVLL